MTPFLAGAGVATVVLSAEAFPLDGFTGERDPLQIRAALLQGAEQRLVVVVVDQISLSGPLLGKIVAVTCEEADVAESSVLVVATHTFSAPHVFPTPHLGEERQTAIAEAATLAATRRAVRASRDGLVPAKLGHGRGRSAVNVNRDMLTRDGWWLGHNDAGFSDHNVEVVRIDDLNGDPIVLLVNYPVQPSVMHESVSQAGGRLVSADLAGAAMRHVERQYEGAVALFLIGAAGDQAPRLSAHRHLVDRHGSWSRVDIEDSGFLLVDLLGEQLGTEVVRVCEAIESDELAPEIVVVRRTLALPGQVPPKNFRALLPTLEYTFEPAEATDAPVLLARIGDTALVAVQVELSASTGVELKQHSPFGQTLVVTLANGSAKYMADAASYDRVTYGAMNSSYARGAAELLTGEVLDELVELFGRPVCVR
jgi:neutral ceramidase